jgi:uncharacterized protein YjbJ (UPF0337 family)
MGSTPDKIKGRIKEAVGVITDNDRLKSEGRTDPVVGEVKEAAEYGEGQSGEGRGESKRRLRGASHSSAVAHRWRGLGIPSLA